MIRRHAHKKGRGRRRRERDGRDASFAAAQRRDVCAQRRDRDASDRADAQDAAERGGIEVRRERHIPRRRHAAREDAERMARRASDDVVVAWKQRRDVGIAARESHDSIRQGRPRPERDRSAEGERAARVVAARDGVRRNHHRGQLRQSIRRTHVERSVPCGAAALGEQKDVNVGRQ